MALEFNEIHPALFILIPTVWQRRSALLCRLASPRLFITSENLHVVRKLESVTIYLMALFQEAVKLRCLEHLIWDACVTGSTHKRGFCVKVSLIH